MKKGKILLISMPFGALERQALGLSLFKARLTNEGIPCDIRYMNFCFADLIGVEDYCWIYIDVPHTAFAGDWIFTNSLYGTNTVLQSHYIKEILCGIWQLDENSVRRILRVQSMAEHFLDYVMCTLPWDEYYIVGFTSTFEQNISSLALAKRIKVAHPDIKIVFGGANWEDEMGLELHRQFPFVDYVCSGEADESFPALAHWLLNGGREDSIKRDSIPGLVYRNDGQSIQTKPAQPVNDVDSLPIPDYSDFFRDFDLSSAGTIVVPTLLFEGSRGCWWGAKHHCMFCGLNGRTLFFRSKSTKRALSEVEYLVRRWKIDMLQAVDNVINMAYFREFFPSIARAEQPIRFFYEIRANLSRDQVKLLRNAGVLHVQPGIESLNNHVLNLMRKGTTALQNIQLLKWCYEYGMQADWNLLYGFPGETHEDYDQMMRLMPQIRFLNAPTACGPIRLDRFSPYFSEAKAYGLVNVRPMAAYKYLYPFSEKSLNKIAYYFDYDYDPNVTISDRSTALIQYVNEWKENPERGRLQSLERPDRSMAIIDTRSNAVRRNAIINGIDKEVYCYCDSVRSLSEICKHLECTFPNTTLNETKVSAFLDTLVALGYMVTDGTNYLSLALRVESLGENL